MAVVNVKNTKPACFVFNFTRNKLSLKNKKRRNSLIKQRKLNDTLACYSVFCCFKVPVFLIRSKQQSSPNRTYPCQNCMTAAKSKSAAAYLLKRSDNRTMFLACSIVGMSIIWPRNVKTPWNETSEQSWWTFKRGELLVAAVNIMKLNVTNRAK